MSFIFFVHMLALLFSFFVTGALIGAFFSNTFRKKLIEFFYRRRLALLRSLYNPILKPGSHPWSAEAVMNPAAIVLGGRTHLVYRAIGMDGASRLGYASSRNGIFFDQRLPYPIYIAQKPSAVPGAVRHYSPVIYPSGGSWGGCEDPRMVSIDGRIYITYNAFDGWDYIRVAFIAIDEKDFLAKRFWKWSPAQLLSPPGERHKNWVLFPEKINGKFALLHNLYGETPDRVCIEYIDNLDTFNPEKNPIKSPDPLATAPQNIAWHYRMRGAGPPPVRTKKGWLLFYHAMTSPQDNRYKLGALLLDLNDPTQVLHRAALPVLTPDMPYENEGKPGVVYACGATVRPSTLLGAGDDTLFIYYGGADKVICVASAPLDSFVESIIEGNDATLSTGPTFTT